MGEGRSPTWRHPRCAAQRLAGSGSWVCGSDDHHPEFSRLPGKTSQSLLWMRRFPVSLFMEVAELVKERGYPKMFFSRESCACLWNMTECPTAAPASCRSHPIKVSLLMECVGGHRRAPSFSKPLEGAKYFKEFHLLLCLRINLPMTHSQDRRLAFGRSGSHKSYSQCPSFLFCSSSVLKSGSMCWGLSVGVLSPQGG